MLDIIDWIGNAIGDLVSGLGNFISSLSPSQILSSIVGIVPRSIAFLRSLFLPLYRVIEGSFSSFGDFMGANSYALLFFTCIGFIVMLGFKRGVTK